MIMLLIYNTIIDDSSRHYFDKIARERLFPGIQHDILYLDQKLDGAKKYSHLLITGSELSACSGSKYDPQILRIIEMFVQNNKAILGICHGHQMLAKSLAGDDCCRRAKEPEFGFKSMIIKNDPLFDNIINPIFLESRYDEIYKLPEEFKIIAANNTDAVQAFRYKDLPIWGVQFHPEFMLDDGSAMLQKHFSLFPKEKRFYRNDLMQPNQLIQNLNIFNNFISSGLQMKKIMRRNYETTTKNSEF
jgi:GMP synthase-like glutamine amidotransferase